MGATSTTAVERDEKRRRTVREHAGAARVFQPLAGKSTVATDRSVMSASDATPALYRYWYLYMYWYAALAQGAAWRFIVR